MTNNQVEYEVLIVELKLTKDIRVKSLVVKSGSQLIIGQVKVTYETKVPYLNKYLENIKGLMGNFDHFELERFIWSENDHADALAKLASMKASSGN